MEVTVKTAPAVRNWQLPGWVTPRNLALIAAGIAAAAVIILLARAVGRLAKAASAAAAPPAAPKSSGGRGKLLLLAAAAAGGWVLFERHQNAAAPAKAAPAPSPLPSPRPTITQTAAPHLASPVHLPFSGSTIVWIFVIAAVVAIVLLGPVLRRSS